MKMRLVNSGPLSVRTRQRVAPKARSLLQHPGDVLPRDAEAHGNVHTFVAEVIGYRQVLQAPAIGQAI